ncbi:MAG: OmpH family outer membrane protein [Bacteroides sp.]
MLKKFALLLLLVLPMGIFAQTLKFGHVESYKVIETMPEYTKAMTDLQNLQKKYSEEVKRASDEFQKKYQEFMQQQDSLPKNIAERRQKELQDLMERGQQFEQEVQQNMQKAQQDMTAPIFKKAEDAVKAVGTEGGFIYIFDLSRTPIPFVNDKQSIDVTPLVKTKLGIK